MLSVIILTKNEEDRIKACLESVKWADEIIVCDTGSEDETLAIAKKYTDKIFEVSGEDFASWRNQAMEKTSSDWILFVDPDERVLESLRKEIEVMITLSDFSAFAISRKNIVFGQEVRYGPFWPDWVIRLLKSSDFETWEGKIHEYPKFKGKLGYSKNSLLHLTHRDVEQIVLKSLEWSKIEAKLRLDSSHPKMTGLRFLRIILSEMFNQGILRRGFFNGTIGIMDSILQAFSMYITYIRLWQIQQPKQLNEVYDEIDQKLIDNNFKY